MGGYRSKAPVTKFRYSETHPTLSHATLAIYLNQDLISHSEVTSFQNLQELQD
jgi:hypothetical protein